MNLRDKCHKYNFLSKRTSVLRSLEYIWHLEAYIFLLSTNILNRGRKGTLLVYVHIKHQMTPSKAPHLSGPTIVDRNTNSAHVATSNILKITSCTNKI